jgi:dephospho-CoA kinase
MVIGVTGNSGSGKSEISKILSNKINAKIIDADKVVKELYTPGQEYYNKILELFGNKVLEKNNKLNRNKIAEIIYNNESEREKLNNLTYKYVVDEIKKRVKKEKNINIIIDAPLLFESKLDEICDITVAVLAEKSLKINRICTRDNIEQKIAISRLAIQKEDSYYQKKADYIVTNNGKKDEINLEEICTRIGKN